MAEKVAVPVQRLREADWESLIKRIKEKKVTPFLGSGSFPKGLSFRSETARRWADEEGYPWEDRDNLARVSRYIAVNSDDNITKSRLVDELAKLPPPDFETDPYEPHRVLSELNLPLYITTNYDDYMMRALKRRELDAKQEVCRWNQMLEDTTSVFDDNFEPTPAQPVVFHFHGYTENSDSLVLTEDDYFQFLINVSTEAGTKVIPSRIQKALSRTSLLLLGYQLDDWDFRVMFHLLASTFLKRSGMSHVCVQVEPLSNEAPADQKDRAQAFLQTYFERYKASIKFRVYLGTCQEFVKELKDRWEKDNAEKK